MRALLPGPQPAPLPAPAPAAVALAAGAEAPAPAPALAPQACEKDQLKGKSGFMLTQANRSAYVLQVQSLMSEMLGEGCNDLADGDSGVEGRGVRRRKESDNHEVGHKAKKAKSKVKMVSYKGWEWQADQKFEIEKLIGKMVSTGEVPGRGSVKAGTVLYKVLWKDFPPEIATWEEESAIHDDYIDDYDAGLEAETEMEGGESDDEGSEEDV